MKKLIVLIASATVALSGTTTWASPDGEPNGHARSHGDRSGNHCISPRGQDLNEVYGVSEQIVTGFCAEVASGEKWRAGAPWFMAKTFDQVPDDFVPVGATPLDDFLAKFTHVRYVVDAGTRQERTVIHRTSSAMWTDTSGETDGVSPITLGVFSPLRVGPHTLDKYWVFSAMHCDGLVANVDENCLPAGETFYGHTDFEVIAGHN